MFSVEIYEEDTGTWQKLDEDVLRLSVQRGMASGEELSAVPAVVNIVLTNHSGTYSPVGWSYYGAIGVGKKIRILHGAEPVFSGFITTIVPVAGAFGERTVQLTCSDLLAKLQRARVKLPPANSLRTDEAVRRCTAAVFKTGFASGSVSISAMPDDGDTVSIGGVTYTFRTTLAQPYDVLRNLGAADAAVALAAAINDDAQEASLYADNTPRHPTVTAAVEFPSSGGTETLTQSEEDTPQPDWAWVGKEVGGGSGQRYLAQRFTPQINGKISMAYLYLQFEPYLTGSGQSITHNLALGIYTETQSGLPGTKIGEAVRTRTFTWPETGAWEDWLAFGFALQVTVKANTNYWLVLRPQTPETSGFSLSGWYSVKWHGTASATSPWGVAEYEIPEPGEWQTLEGDNALMLVITVDAVTSPSVVLTANAHGSWANDIALSASGAALSASGATLSGGADYADQSLDQGRGTLDVFAPVADDTDALAILQGVVDSEYGRLYCDRAGNLVFRSRNWLAMQANGTSSATLSGDYIELLAEGAGERLVNLARVSYTLPRTITSGVIARAPGTISVPGRGGDIGDTARWSGAQPLLSEQGTVTFILPYIEPESGGRMSAAEVYTPFPGTDYTVTDSADESGFDYTYSKNLRLSLAIASFGVEVTFVNTALGTLYVHDLQIRGVGYVFKDKQEAVSQDAQSQELYGVYEEALDLPHALVSADALATSLTSHLLARHRTPRVRVTEVVVDAVTDTTWLTRDIGEKVAISDDVLGDTEALIMGIQFDYEPHSGQLPVTFTIYDTDKRAYWQLGHATYGKLGNTTRLAL